jgi:Peptidase family C25
MKKISIGFALLLTFVSPQLAICAGFPVGAATQPLLMVHGETNVPSSGDYISSTVGLNTYYSFFIEVTPGLSSMQVEIYDPDIRQGADLDEQNGNAIRDQTRSTGMVMAYTLLNPAGGTVATQTGSATLPAASHATWWTFATPATPAAGHWELRVDSGTGSNVAGYGIRARGFNGASQVDLNVYAHSYVSYQLHGVGFRTYTFHPYVTGYCSLRMRDFDNDDGAGNTTSFTIASALPSAASEVFGTLSLNDQWATNDTTRATFFSDLAVQRPGIWTSTLSVSGTSVGGATNEGQVYFANTNDVTGTTAPTAQPQNNSWRTYLPMLNGSVPVKPDVYQKLFFVSGPNPMVVGSQTILRVTVGVANRTARPIVFSAANLVSAFIPGGVVTYGGTPLLSAGAIVAQPAIGGSGAITWNPGTLAAGAVADMTYLIRITPTAAGRVIVTGTPAANGTSARYVDETGNTTQARATYTWGPLCELAATTGSVVVPTPATIAKVSALRGADGLVDIEWRTGVEVGVASWHVLTDLQPNSAAVPGGEIVAAGDRVDGQNYRLNNIQLSGDVFYLRNRDIDGRSTLHGPYQVGADSGANESPSSIPWPQIANDSQLRQTARAQSLPTAERNRVQIRVRQRGIQSVRFEALAALNTTLAGADIAQIAVLRDGQPWPRRVRSADAVFGSNDRIEFVAEAEPGIVVNYRIYELVIDPARALNIDAAPLLQGLQEPLTAIKRRTLIADQNGYAFSSPLADPFYMTRFSSPQGQPVSQRFALSTPHRISADPARVEVSLWGGLDYEEIADEHGYRIDINGQNLTENHFNGLAAHALAQSVPPALLSGDTQQLDVEMLADRSPFDVFNIESVAIDYSAAPVIDGGALDFVAHAMQGDDPSVPMAELIFQSEFDLQTPNFDCAAINAQSRCWTLQTQGLAADAVAYRVETDGTTKEIGLDNGLIRDAKIADARLWLANPAVMQQPEIRLQTAEPASVEGNDYLVIAHPDFAAGLNALLALRQSQGLTTQVVTTEGIYARSGGQPSTQAISAFIAQSVALGTRYVLLVGGDSYDSAGYLNTGSIGFVPSPYIQLHPVVRFGAADSLYADVDGDRKPDVAIGRFPVRTPAELQTLIDKTLALEGKVSGRALFLADDADTGGFSFDTAQQSLSSRLGAGWQIRHESLDTSSTEQLGALAQQELQTGLGLVHYMGHSSPSAWSSPAPGILPPNTIFAGALADANHPTLLIQWGCWNSYHVVPAYNTLAHAWLLGPGAAGAVIGTTAITEIEHDYALSERLLNALSQHQRLGDALKAAKRDLATGDPDLVDVLLGVTLLGDPALMLRTP